MVTEFRSAAASGSHDIVTHGDTTATGAQLNTLVGAGATALHTHSVVGTYTGDGGTTHAITGLTGTPKLVLIWRSVASAVAWVDRDFIGTTSSMVNNHGSGLAWSINKQATGPSWVTDSIIAVGAGNFTVDDGGSDAHPNKSSQVYEYFVVF
jgi:hypothetical protein